MGRPKGSRNKPKGLGDTVAEITKATGIDKVVKAVAGEDCGCQQRQEWLNKKFPYVNEKKGCMDQEQIFFYESFKNKYLQGKSEVKIPHEDLQELISLYNSVFQTNIKGCLGCNASEYVKRLEKVYEASKEHNGEPVESN